MYEEVRSQSLVLAEPPAREPDVTALLELLEDLNEENTQLAELVGILQKQLVLARLRSIVAPCFP
jgi:hypothetical protein